jgi:hypothetical protein
MFTVHAGEFLVGQYIESTFKDKRVWLPTKDAGIDLLVTNSTNTKTLGLQVKFSRDFLPIMNLKPSTQKQLKSCTWFNFDRDKLGNSAAHYWIFVLLGFEGRSYDYLIVKPKELLRQLEMIHGASPKYRMYVWVTNQGRAWLARGLKRLAEDQIANNTFTDKSREVTTHLNDWSAIKNL